MLIKHLIENVDDEYGIASLVNYMKNNCSEFVNEFGDKPPIFRTERAGDGFHLRNTVEERKPKSFVFRNPHLTHQYNKLLSEYGHNTRIHNAAFGTTTHYDDFTGIDEGGEWYYLIPVGSYSYTYDIAAGDDFNIEHPMLNHFSMINRGFEFSEDEVFDNIEYLEDTAKYTREMSDEKEYKDMADAIMNARDSLVEISEALDKYVFGEQYVKEYKRFVEAYKKAYMALIELIELGVDVNEEKFDFGVFVINDLKKNVFMKILDSVKAIREHVEKNYVTDTIKSELFSKGTEIIFNTDKYLIVDVNMIDYKTLMEKVKNA